MSEAGGQPMESELAKSYRAQSYWLDSIEDSLEPLPPQSSDCRLDWRLRQLVQGLGQVLA